MSEQQNRLKKTCHLAVLRHGIREELVEDVEVAFVRLLVDHPRLLQKVSFHVRTGDLPVGAEVNADEFAESERKNE